MRTLVIHDRPMAWSNPIIELDNFFGPIVNPVEPVAEIVSESPHNYILNFSLMGFRKKDLHVKIENNEIVLEGQNRTFSRLFKNRKGEYHSSFERRFAVSKDMDTDRIRARFKNGKLELTIPKKNEYINCREIPVMDTEQENIRKVEVRQGFFNEIKQKFQNFLTNGVSHNGNIK